MKMKHIVTLGIALIFSTACLVSKSRSDKKIIGHLAPSFKASALYPDGTVKDFNLSDHAGKNIILYFYPKDGSKCCTMQAKQFRDAIKTFESKNILIVGISSDTIKTHQKFQEEYSLPFLLVSDAQNNYAISKMYHANGWFGFAQRKTFLINTQGTVFKIFEKIDIENQISDILQCFK